MAIRYCFNHRAQQHFADSLNPYHDLINRMALFRESLEDYRLDNHARLLHDPQMRMAMEWLEDGLDAAYATLPDPEALEERLENTLEPEDVPEFFTAYAEEY